MVKQFRVWNQAENLLEYDGIEDDGGNLVLHSDYAALEAKCRDLTAMLERVERSSRPRNEPAWQYDEIRALLAKN